MADEPADGEDNLDDAQAGKNAALRTRARSSERARQQREDRPAVQNLLRRARQGNRMIGAATIGDSSEPPTRSERWYGKKEDTDG